VAGSPPAFRRGVENALLHRLDPARFPLTPAGAPFVGYRLFELARRSLEVRGYPTGGCDQRQIASIALGLVEPEWVRGDGYLATSDFPAAMLSVARATLTAGYHVRRGRSRRGPAGAPCPTSGPCSG
jgi:hypothetical protein